MTATDGLDNFRVYSSSPVAAHYASLTYLTACERLLFDKYLRHGMAILDAGVGGGRTTPYLSEKACHYFGIDYSEAMVESCRARFPNLKFAVADASDLSACANDSFNAVVMAFNTVDYIVPAERRQRCFEECWRVLQPGGVLIFSSHNPRAVLVRPGWDQRLVRTFAERISPSRIFFPPLVVAVTALKAIQAVARAIVASFVRIIGRMTKPVFWRGEGHVVDSAHGGLLTHCWVPRRAIDELSRSKFAVAEVMGDDYPRRSRPMFTDWYYYVFVKHNRANREEMCA